MIRQFPLALRWPRRQCFEYFHPGGNAAALAAVKALVEDPSAAPWVYLQGASGAGKSHLLVAVCRAAGALGWMTQYLPLSLLQEPVAALRGLSGSSLLALDDIETVAGDRTAEHAMFDLYNQAKVAGTALLVASKVMPSQLGFSIPDLRSRFGACLQFPLKMLDDEQRREVLKWQATARGMVLDDTVLNWLFARQARDLGSLLELFEQIDQAQLATQRSITIPFLRQLLYPSTDSSRAS